MRINFITKNEHIELTNIFNNFPKLTLQNKGYETPNKDKFSDDDKAKFEEVTNILKKSVHGFSSFTNFRYNKDNKIEIRLQYNYSYDGSGLPFTGVGYVLLDELLNGFNK